MKHNVRNKQKARRILDLFYLKTGNFRPFFCAYEKRNSIFSGTDLRSFGNKLQTLLAGGKLVSQCKQYFLV